MSDLTPRPSRPKRVPPPIVFPSYAIRQGLTLLLSSPQLALAILPSPPTWLRHLKLLIYLLLLLNINSFPLRWHYNLFRPVLATILRARPYLPFVRRSAGSGEMTSPKTGRKIRLEALPLGLDIFEEKVWAQHRATPDDCDYLLHLSNSSYLKQLDPSRSALLFPHFFRLYTDGGRLHLGGSTLTHHREIPLMARYEIRVQLAAWDEKWFYLVARFTSCTDPETHKSGRAQQEGGEPAAGSRTPRSPGLSLSRSARDLRELLRDVARPEHEAKNKDSAKGKRSSHHPQSLSMSRTTSTDAAPQPQPTTSNSSSSEPTLYATVISGYCAKYSRKTIPPWLVVASSGFGTWASTRANWDKAEQCRERYAQGARRLSAVRGGAAGGGGAMRKKGKEHEAFLAAFDPAVAKGAAAAGPDSGSSSAAAASTSQSNGNDWMKPTSWSLVEWEARRLRGLEEVGALGGLAPTAVVPATLKGEGASGSSRRGTPSGGGAAAGRAGYFE